MAGHPQEPSWQPGVPDQGRAAWAQPSYPPPSGTPEDTFAYPQEPDESYQGYPGPSYNVHDQAFPGPTAAPRPGRQRTADRGTEKGFLGSLFDFTFSSFVTPKIIKVLYVLFTIWTALWSIIIIRFGFHYGVAAGVFILVVVIPIFILLTLGVYRVILEAFMVAFRIYEELKKIRQQGETRS